MISKNLKLCSLGFFQEIRIANISSVHITVSLLFPLPFLLTFEVGSVIIPSLQMRKLRLREFR